MDSVLVSQRLRELRQSYNGTGLSFERLAEALQQRYQCGISMQNLKNYERPAINNGTDFVTKGNAIPGMRTENLFMLADFYGVSVDWILGITPQKTRNTTVQAAADLTGLSWENISFLSRMKGSFVAKVVNFILDDARLDDGDDRTLVKLLRFFLEYDGGKHKNRRVNIYGDITETPVSKNGLRTDAIYLDERVVENSVLAEIENRLRRAKRSCGNGKH